MQLEDWKTILLDAHNLGCSQVQFIGGEPTGYPYLIELISYARSNGYKFIEIFTNGTIFTEKLKKAFKKYQVYLAFSIYSFDDVIHDSITQRSGSLIKTIESIKWALKVGLKLRVGIIDIGINSQTIEKTRSFLEHLGVSSVSVDRHRRIGRGSSSTTSSSQIDELCGKCWEGKLCVTPTGDIYPCVFSRFYPVGITDEGLSKVLQGNRLHDFRSKLKSKAQNQAQCHPNRTCTPATRCGPERCNPKYEICNPKCAPHTCGPNCNPGHGPDKCEPTCKPSYRPFG
jgi:MoaA/NifB/PqqE/SkfB family radical SAM enzyme